MSTFFDDFNAALPDMQAAFGEPFIFAGQTGQAVSVDVLEKTLSVMTGGRFENATVTLTVMAADVTRLGINEGSIIVVRGQRVRVYSMPSDGDDTITLNCGPAGVNLR